MRCRLPPAISQVSIQFAADHFILYNFRSNNKTKSPRPKLAIQRPAFSPLGRSALIKGQILRNRVEWTAIKACWADKVKASESHLAYCNVHFLKYGNLRTTKNKRLSCCHLLITYYERQVFVVHYTEHKNNLSLLLFI